MGDITRVAKETLEAPRVIKVYNAQDYQNSQFEAVNEHNRRSHMRLVLTKGLSNPVVQMVTVDRLGVRAVDRDLRRHHQRMTMGDLLAFLVALVQIAQPLRSLVGVAGPLQQGIAAGESIFELLDEPVEPAGGTLHRAARARRYRVRATCRSRIRPARGQPCRMSACAFRRARWWRSSGAPAAASRRW